MTYIQIKLLHKIQKRQP